MPNGLKISNVAAKGRNAECLEQTFDGIPRDAESKLLDTTIKALQIKEQQLKANNYVHGSYLPHRSQSRFVNPTERV